MTKLRKKTNRGSLMVLVVIMAAGGVLRLGSGIGQALALTAEANVPDGIGNAPVVCPAPPVALAAALKEREDQVKTDEKTMLERAAALDLAKLVIDKRMAELEKAEQDLRATLALADGAAESDLAKLTEVYQNMKPKDAAAIFETMEPDFAAGFVGRMRPESAAALMADLQPGTAYTISVLLAGRNSSAPKN